MKNTTKLGMGAGILIGATVLVGGGLAQAAGESESGPEVETPISGSALERASATALAHTGGGSVTGTEVGDEESYYEVEVTLEDGTEVDVQLDERFQVVDIPDTKD